MPFFFSFSTKVDSSVKPVHLSKLRVFGGWLILYVLFKYNCVNYTEQNMNSTIFMKWTVMYTKTPFLSNFVSKSV